MILFNYLESKDNIYPKGYMSSLKTEIFELYEYADNKDFPVSYTRIDNETKKYTNIFDDITRSEWEDVETLFFNITNLYQVISPIDFIAILSTYEGEVDNINTLKERLKVDKRRNAILDIIFLSETIYNDMKYYIDEDEEEGEEKNYNNLLILYPMWKKFIYNSLVESTRYQFAEMKDRVKEFEDMDPLLHTEIEKEIREVEYKYYGEDIGDIISFINKLNLTKYVPYVQYNDSIPDKEMNYNKIFNGIYVVTENERDIRGSKSLRYKPKASKFLGSINPIGAPLNSNIIVPSGIDGNALIGISLDTARKTSKSTFYEINDIQKEKMHEEILNKLNELSNKNIFYFIIYGGDELTQTSWNYSKLYVGRFNIKTRILTVEIRGVASEVILMRLQQVLPELEYKKDNRLGGVVYFPDISFDYHTFNSSIMLDPLINKYFFLYETENPFPESQVRYIHFKKGIEDSQSSEKGDRVPSSVYIQMFNRKGMIGKENISGLDFTKNFIEVNLVKIVSEPVLEEFMYIFTRFLSRYKEDREGLIEQQILELSTELIDVKDFEPDYRDSKRAPGKKQNRQHLARSLYIDTYSSLCPNPPLPLFNEELENPELLKDLEDRERLNFNLANEDIVTLVCMGREKHINMVKNTLSNSRDYPLIPCCSHEKKKEPITIDITKKKIGITRILLPWDKGDPKKGIKDIFSLAPGYENVSIIGTEKGPYTFLDAITKSLDIEEISTPGDILWEMRQFMRVSDEIDDEYLKKDQIYKEIASQELYGTNFSFDIKEGSQEFFIDPRLYYRILEEMYEIQILGLTVIDDEIVPDIPRYSKPIHIRKRISERQLMVYFRHWGSSIDDLKNPQVEVIEANSKRIFEGNSKIADTLWEFYKSFNETFLIAHNDPNSIIKEYSEEEEEPYMAFPLHEASIKNVWKDFFDSADYSLLKPISQFIDNFGKLRGIKISKNEDIYTMIVPPGAPLNLPSFSLSESDRRPNKDIIENFGDPSALSVGRDGTLQGLWYPNTVNFEYWFFILSKDTENKSIDIPSIPSPVDLSGGKSIYDIDKNLEKRRFVFQILKIILWLYLIFKENVKEDIKMGSERVDKFSNFFLIIDKISYDIVPPRLLPEVKAIKDAIYAVSEWGNLVIDEYIIMYSEKFKKGIIYFLTTFEQNFSYFNFPIPKSLTDISTEDIELFLKSSEDMKVFSTTDKLKDWINFTDGEMAVTLLSNKNANHKDPYFYRSEDRLYIIQNVVRGEHGRAVEVSLIWGETGINEGFYTEMVLRDPPPNILEYGIDSIVNQIRILNKPIEEMDEESINQYVLILKYPGGRYAALLRL